MSFFNSKGELNASNFAEALQQLAKYASIMEENVPSNMALSGPPSLTDSQRDELVSRALLTHEGKLAMAQSMANPIN